MLFAVFMLKKLLIEEDIDIVKIIMISARVIKNMIRAFCFLYRVVFLKARRRSANTFKMRPPLRAI